ncbi:MAG: YjjG family noncanonical pyrimidine nucleotidase [Rectinemataceae bacterium]
MPGYELVLIDADGTLFDFKRAERHALSLAFAQFGLKATEELFEVYDEINGNLWRSLEKGEVRQEELKRERFRLLFERIGTDSDAESFSRAYIERLSEASFLLEHAEEICRYLSGKYILAIITNGIREVQLSRIRNSSIDEFIDYIVISEEAKSSKPSRGIFEYACDLTKVHDKEKIIIIGDSLSSDIKGGVDFGIDTCWLNAASTVNATTILPRYEVKSLLDVMNFL